MRVLKSSTFLPLNLSIVACDWYIFSQYVNLMYLFTFFIFIHTYCMFVTVILSHCIIVTIQKKNDMQQCLLQIKKCSLNCYFCSN